ncbi:MAG: glucokinase [Nanobdellota archaeon]
MRKEIIVAQDRFDINDYDFFLLCGSIDVDNTVLSMMGVKGKHDYDIITKYYFNTHNIRDFSSAINEVLYYDNRDYGIEVNRCAIAAAGPVSRRRGYISLTNLDRTVHADSILNNTMLNKVILLNDFEAEGYALDLIDMSSKATELPHIGQDLTDGSSIGYTCSVLGAGKGLGMTIAPYDYDRHLHVPLPSEGGHMDFTPYDDLERELVDYLRKHSLSEESIHPELERVLSERGIERIYGFLREKGMYEESDITRVIDNLSEGYKAANIFDNYDHDETCKKAVSMFISIYARAGRYLALVSECYGGLFITGKIAVDNKHLFRSGEFMEHFEEHDKRSSVLRKVPVYIVEDEDMVLKGCCNVATNFFNIR